MLARSGHALYVPNYAALRPWNSLQQVCHEAGHRKKRCLAIGNPARAEESLNLGISQKDLMARLGGPDSQQWQLFQKTFAPGSIWGSRTDLGSVTLHADLNKSMGNFFLHFDLYNPTRDVAG